MQRNRRDHGDPGRRFFRIERRRDSRLLTKDGSVIWEYDTNREFQTLNGVPARGASMQSGGPAVVGGMVYVSSGYGDQADVQATCCSPLRFVRAFSTTLRFT